MSLNLTNIYFIQNENGDIKIGRSIEVENRVDQLQIANSNNLKILYVIENMTPTFETFLHLICQQYHLQGEWYHFNCIKFLLRHEFYKQNMLLYKSNKNKTR